MTDGSKIPGSTSLSELRQSNADPFNKEFFKLYFLNMILTISPLKGVLLSFVDIGQFL